MVSKVFNRSRSHWLKFPSCLDSNMWLLSNGLYNIVAEGKGILSGGGGGSK